MFLSVFDDLSKISRTLLRRFRDEPNDRDNSEVKGLNKAGKTFSYLEANTVIDTLNSAFTPLGWGSDTSHVEWQPGGRDEAGRELPSRQVAVHCKLFVYTPWGTVTKSGWGARTVMSTADGTKMEFGDDLKSAASDALKKAATQLGVYNYEYRKGSLKMTEEVKPIAIELNVLSKELNMSNEEFLNFCSGVCHKTILGAGDLTLPQAKACLEILKSSKTYPKLEMIS